MDRTAAIRFLRKEFGPAMLPDGFALLGWRPVDGTVSYKAMPLVDEEDFYSRVARAYSLARAISYEGPDNVVASALGFRVFVSPK